jgi:hypothetical protein
MPLKSYYRGAKRQARELRLAPGGEQEGQLMEVIRTRITGVSVRSGVLASGCDLTTVSLSATTSRGGRASLSQRSGQGHGYAGMNLDASR